MESLDRFRKPNPGVPLPQLCYDIAYSVLPRYAFKELPKLMDLYRNTPATAGPFFYIMAAQMRKVEPNLEVAKRFNWHHGHLSENREYFALEYPAPPPVRPSSTPNEQTIVLAPYFSVIIRGTGSADVEYFILGQAPLGGETTIRKILADGRNCNLGPGPEPKLTRFLDVVGRRPKKPA
jgi:hypothetical protein